MATNRPTAAELVDAVLEFLSADLQNELQEPSTKFKLRVATNVLKIVRRELELSSSHDNVERMELQALLQTGEDDIEALNRELCGKIRRGDYDRDEGELIELLTRLTLNKLSMDNPGYSTYLALTP